MTLACKNNSLAPYQKAFESYFTVMPQYQSILIIPNEGCNGCIRDATDYVINSITERDSTFVIFTNIYDTKRLKLMLGDKIQKPYILLDTKNQFFKKRISSIYPQVWSIEKGSVTRVSNF